MIYIDSAIFGLGGFATMKFMRRYVPISTAMHQPSLDEWFTMLGKIKDQGWRVRSDGSIRDSEGRCPLVAIIASINRKIGRGLTTEFMDALSSLGYDPKTDAVRQIVRAADDHITRDSARQRMLQVLGLTEKPLGSMRFDTYHPITLAQSTALQAHMDALQAHMLATIAKAKASEVKAPPELELA